MDAWECLWNDFTFSLYFGFIPASCGAYHSVEEWCGELDPYYTPQPRSINKSSKFLAPATLYSIFQPNPTPLANPPC